MTNNSIDKETLDLITDGIDLSNGFPGAHEFNKDAMLAITKMMQEQIESNEKLKKIFSDFHEEMLLEHQRLNEGKT